MDKIWRILILTCIFSGLFILNSYLLINIEKNFPNNDGFTRYIIFVRPGNEAPGYYIIADELNGDLHSKWADIVFHGRGSLEINLTDKSAIWSVQSYLNQSENVSLYLKYITPIERIERKSGLFTHQASIYEEIPYILVRPSAGVRISTAILYPINKTIDKPKIIQGNRYVWINNADFLLVQDTNKQITVDNISTDAKILFLRKNSNGTLTDFLIMSGTYLKYNGTTYYTNTSSTNLIWHKGSIKYSKINIISKQSSNLAVNSLPELDHPFLYYNRTSFNVIKDRVLNSSPWNVWFNSLKNSADSVLANDLTAYAPPLQADYTLNFAFLSQILGNISYLNKAKELLNNLKNIHDFTGDSEHLRRSIAISKYVIAYDMIYNNLSSEEKSNFRDDIIEATNVLYDTFKTTPKNNHILIESAAIGLVGLSFNKLEWVQLAIKSVNEYLNNNIKSEGGCYEGQGYCGYGFMNLMRFIYALKNIQINYYEDPNFQNLFKFNINCVSPLGTIPIFEDTRRNPEVAEMCLWAAPHLSFGGYLKWIYERRNNYSNIFSMLGPSVSRIIMYERNITAIEPVWNESIVYEDSGLAFLRSGNKPTDLYLTISCKKYYQSHTHFDENSIELWAYGAYIIANPGYGTYGDEHHKWLTSTEASNTILINGNGQVREYGEGFINAIFSRNLEFISSSTINTYIHPSSFYSHPSLFYLIIAIYIMLSTSFSITFYLIMKIPKNKIDIKNKEVNKVNNRSDQDNDPGSNDNPFTILIKLVYLDRKLYQNLNNLNQKAWKIFLLIISIVLPSVYSILFLNNIYIAINEFLYAYYTPTSGYKDYIELFFYLEYGSMIVITIIILLIILTSSKIISKLLKLYYRTVFRINIQNDWNFRNLHYLLIPFIICVSIFYILVLQFWIPKFLINLDIAFTNAGSIERITELIIELFVQAAKILLIMLIILIPFITWGIYATSYHFNPIIKISIARIRLSTICLCILSLCVIMLIFILCYYYCIAIISSFHISSILS